MENARFGGQRAFIEEFRESDFDDYEYDIREDDKMLLCVRGNHYEIDVKCVKPDPKLRLHRLAMRWKVKCENGQARTPFYINRNPVVVQCILDYQVTGELHLPDHCCGRSLRKELAFWGVGEEVIESCCLWKIRTGMDVSKNMCILQQAFENTEGFARNAKTWREKVFAIQLVPFSSRLGSVVYISMVVVYILFLLTVLLETLTSFRSPAAGTPKNVTYETIGQWLAYNPVDKWLIYVDFALLNIILLSILFWFAVCPLKKRYFGTLRTVDVIGTISVIIQWLPLSILMFADLSPEWIDRITMVFGLVKLTRIIPMFYFLRPFKSTHVLSHALVASKRELILLVVLVILSSIIFGYLAYVVEIVVGGTYFKTLPDALWWAVVTLTTIGYGDMYPQSPQGRFIGILCAITGIIVIAMPVPIIAGNFTRIYDLMNVAEYQQEMAEKAERRTLVSANKNQGGEDVKLSQTGQGGTLLK